MRRVLAVFALVACGGEGTPEARAPKGPDVSWVASKKLDADLQEFVLRHYDEQLAFLFRVRLAADGAEQVVRCRPAELEAVVLAEPVTAVTCAPPPTSSPSGGGDEWRKKVEPDVRTVHAAGSACPMAIYLRFEGEVGEGERRELESLGAAVRTMDARSAIVFVPTRNIPHVAELAFVMSIELPSRAYGE